MVAAKTLLLSTLSLLTASVVAQTPLNFTPSVQQTLYVTYQNNNIISPAGKLIARNDTLSPPNITSTVFPSTPRAIIFLIDLDVLRNNTRVPLLHWLAPNVTRASNTTTNSSLIIPVPAYPGATYNPPNPPATDIPHRYLFLLFAQPANFSIPASYGNLSANRVNFTYPQFIAETGLGAPLAANYIRVQGQNATNTTTGTGTSTSAAVATATRNAAAGAQVGGQALLGLVAAGAFALL